MTMIRIGGDGTDNEGVSAYRAEPAGDGTAVKGALVVIHEIWGLADHIKSVADRFAREGYLVLAPDLLSGVGITPEIGEELQRAGTAGEEARTELQPALREAMSASRSPDFAAWAVPALSSLVDELAADPRVNGRIAVTGFCFGGSYAFALAAADHRIRASVPFYGSPPELAGVGEIHCPVLAFYGDQDTRLMETLPEVEQAMTKAGVPFTAKVYPGVGHAFFNDSNAHAYNAEAATDAWQRTLAFLDAHLDPAVTE